MKNILLLNGAKDYGGAKGLLNNTLHSFAKQTLEKLGFNTDETLIDKNYEIESEIQKILKADVLILQMPGWWMGEPWIVKKYIDTVFHNARGIFFSSDGRTHSEPSKNYGTGGMLGGKKYMFSLTWNAPLEAFTDKNEFFGGVGVDGVYLHLHKVFEFIGMSALKTFICTDVIKNPQVEKYTQNYKVHLLELFGN